MAERLTEKASLGATAVPPGDKRLTPRPSLFLRTKLLPPRPAPEILFRPRLAALLEANLARPVTVVAANAGSGKTTLVADFLRSGARPFVWYQLDHTDGDPFVFLSYLAHGIKQAAPEFGEVTFSYLQQAAGELAQHPERAVDVFLTEVLECVEQQLIVVLDDYHHLGTDTPVHAAVDRLIAYLPDVLHIIIISRDMPPLALARLRSQASLSIIDRTELLFTDSETQELFRSVFDLELTPEQLNEYRERTHGWITALQLVRQVAQRQALTAQREAGADNGARVPDLLNVLRQSERDIFDYFAEEVFADETVAVQRFLLNICLLDRVEVEICRRLYPESDSAEILPALVRRNVFMTVARDDRGEEYRLHPLFRSFLLRRLRTELESGGLAAEHVRYAEYFLQQGSWEEGVRHLVHAGEFVRAAGVIADRGGEWIAGGKLTSLSTLAAALPTAALEAHPRALAHRAEAARLRGEFETAQSLFRRAATLLREKQDGEAEAEVLHSLATLARRQRDYDAAFAHLDRAVALTGEASSIHTKCGNTRGLCLVAMGRWTEAEREFRAALQSAEESNDQHHIRLITHNLGLPAMMRGDFEEALHWLRRMLRDEQPPIPQEATAHLNMARCYLYRGDLRACEAHLDHAIERCQLFNLLASRAETFETYGNLYRELGEPVRAAEFYERAARAYDEAGISLARVELMEERALLSLQAGDVVTARAQIDRLLALRPRDKDELGFYTASLARARIMLAQAESSAAALELDPALEYFHAHGLYYYEAQACLALAACALAAGGGGNMIKHLRRALDLAARYDYEYWLKQEVTKQPALFSGEEAIELLPADLRDLALASSSTAAPALAQQSQTVISVKPVTDLTINFLGPVEIVRDPARPLAADAWTTRRARDILCFIVSRRHHRASKEVIIDTFWGETDFAAVEKNFHPTVSHIRKALNSNQPLKQNFLLYRDGDYQLNPEFSYSIDTEEFEGLMAAGEAARRERDFSRCIDCYQKAIDLYRGEFMQGSYDPWVEEQRTYYKEQYLRMMEALAGVAQKTEDWVGSLQMAQRILRDDPYREDIHCMIMRAHAAMGNRMAVKEQYENLCGLLQQELGVEPALPTQKTYKELVA
jgi:LuxR family maltose regulon positive regulatory protein